MLIKLEQIHAPRKSHVAVAALKTNFLSITQQKAAIVAARLRYLNPMLHLIKLCGIALLMEKGYENGFLNNHLAKQDSVSQPEYASVSSAGKPADL